MTQATVNSEQLNALFEERQRYESWLATLETRRPATPTHIYEKVLADYSARLHHVVQQLASHRAVLQDMEGGLLGKLSALDVQEGTNRDEAAEAELRAAVGELNAEQHREVAGRTTSALDQIQRDRASLTDELSRLRAVLAAAGAVPQPAPAAPPTAGAPARRSGAAAVQPPAATATPARGGEWSPASVPVAAPAAPVGRSSGGTRVGAPSGQGAFDDLEFLKSMTESQSSGESVAVGSTTDAQGHALGEQDAQSALAGRHSGGQAATARTTPASQAAEQAKTLKCQECGTLNYPTEWYCERCGAELAAL